MYLFKFGILGGEALNEKRKRRLEIRMSNFSPHQQPKYAFINEKNFFELQLLLLMLVDILLFNI